MLGGSQVIPDRGAAAELPQLSDHAKLFLMQYLEGEDDLEVLLLLRTDSAKEWNALEVSERLNIEPILVSRRLLSLHSRGLLEHPPSGGPLYRFRYRPTSDAMAQATDEIAQIYPRFREAILELVRNAK